MRNAIAGTVCVAGIIAAGLWWGNWADTIREAYAADGLSVTPAVMDRKAKARDILESSVTVRNETGRKISVYPTVNNIEIEEGEQAFKSRSEVDLSDSFANWISVSRAGMELEAGEERALPVRIDVNYNARPGVYHAVVAFPIGNTRAEAEAGKAGAPTLAINLEVEEDIDEDLSIGKFRTERGAFFTLPVRFEYELKNTGNRPLTPRGEVIIYDRNGSERAAIPVNEEGVSVPEGGMHVYKGEWGGKGAGAGRYKAFLSLEFGSTRDGRIQDTVFFWVIPWYAAGIAGSVFIGLVFAIATVIHRRYERWHEERVSALEAARAYQSGVPTRGATGPAEGMRNKKAVLGAPPPRNDITIQRGVPIPPATEIVPRVVLGSAKFIAPPLPPRGYGTAPVVFDVAQKAGGPVIAPPVPTGMRRRITSPERKNPMSTFASIVGAFGKKITARLRGRKRALSRGRVVDLRKSGKK